MAPFPAFLLPTIGQPDEKVSKSGLGDFTYQLFLFPAKPGTVIWGISPALTFPTASDPLLGNENFSASPVVVVLAQPGKMPLGVLAMNSWSYAGAEDREDTNQFMLQYFVSYGLRNGWSIESSPLMTANWKSDDKRWVVPIGGGVNKVFKSEVPVQVKLHAYWHAVRPDSASNWQLMFTVQPVILMN